RYRLGVAVHHDGLETILAQRHRGMHTAVIEFDALADAVRASAQDHDLAPGSGVRLAFLLVSRVQVRRRGGELAGTGIDALVHRMQPELAPLLSHRWLVATYQTCDARIRKSLALQGAQTAELEALESLRAQLRLLAQHILDLREEPRIDARGVEYLLRR